MKDFDMPPENLIYFPVHVGITGECFKKQKSLVFNEFKPKFNIYYVPEVDNVKSYDKIDNLAFAATTDSYGMSNGII